MAKCPIVLGLLFLSAIADTEEASTELRTVDGEVISLESIGIAAGTITGMSESGPRSFAADEVLSVTRAGVQESQSNRHPLLLLPDGQVLQGSFVSADSDSIVLRNSIVGDVRVPLSSVEGILMTTGHGRRTREQIAQRLRSLDRTGDAILMVNDDVLTGVITQFGPDQWVVDADGEERTIRSELIRGVTLDASLLDYASPSDLTYRVRLSDGSLMVATSVDSTADGWQLQTAFGPKIRVPEHAVARVSIRGGKARFLSNAKPLRIQTRPFLDFSASPRMDQSVLGTPLTIHGVRYEKGIGMRGYTRVDFDAKGYERFLATIGLDDVASEEASVLFQVLLDDQVAFDSGEMTPTTPAKEIAIDLMGARVISLVVNFANRGDVGDAANWCEPRLIGP